jgi:hypothetical protein
MTITSFEQASSLVLNIYSLLKIYQLNSKYNKYAPCCQGSHHCFGFHPSLPDPRYHPSIAQAIQRCEAAREQQR